MHLLSWICNFQVDGAETLRCNFAAPFTCLYLEESKGPSPHRHVASWKKFSSKTRCHSSYSSAIGVKDSFFWRVS